MVKTLQQTIIETLHAKPSINPQEEITKRVDFLKNFLVNSGMNGYVLGISGGQDSTLAGKLTQQAINELNLENPNKNYIFHAVRLPYGTQRDEEDAQLALQFIQPTQNSAFDIKPAVDALESTWNQTTENNLSDYAKGNTKARIRMTVQYAIAGEQKLLVIGTDHVSELCSGFFTKWGDQGADSLPLAGLNKRQGKELLKLLGAPEKLYLKAPTADLLDNIAGQPDETELGVTYAEIDDYLEGKIIEAEAAIKIENRYMATEHKRHDPVTPRDEWWK